MNNGKNRQGLAAAAALSFGVLVLAVPEAAARDCRGHGTLPAKRFTRAVPVFCRVRAADRCPAARRPAAAHAAGLGAGIRRDRAGAAAVLGWRLCSVCAAGRAAVRCGAHYAAGCCTFAGAGLLLRARVCDRLRRRGSAGECTAWRGAVRGADRGEFGGGSGLSAAIPHCRGEHCSPAGRFRCERPFRKSTATPT